MTVAATVCWANANHDTIRFITRIWPLQTALKIKKPVNKKQNSSPHETLAYRLGNVLQPGKIPGWQNFTCPTRTLISLLQKFRNCALCNSWALSEISENSMMHRKENAASVNTQYSVNSSQCACYLSRRLCQYLRAPSHEYVQQPVHPAGETRVGKYNGLELRSDDVFPL